MRQVDDKLRLLFRSICTKPGMYVGKENYREAMIFIDGYVSGRADGAKIPIGETLLCRDFRVFLANRINKGKQLVWWLVPTKLKDWNSLGEGEKLHLMLREFEEFANVLTRLAAEL